MIAMRSRDDFSKNTKQILANRVGSICSNPECKQVTFGPHSKPDKFINVGVAGHITAASPGGPRYNPLLTTLQRKSANNGIWLCQKCGKLVDSDESRYTVKTLVSWKQQAEDDQFNKISTVIEPFKKISDEEEKIKLLRVLMKKSTAGFHSDISVADCKAVTGTVGFWVFPVKYNADIKIFDLIGGINKNRVSVIMNNERAVTILVLDGLGNLQKAKYKLPVIDIGNLIFITWNQERVEIWFSKDSAITMNLTSQFRGKWIAMTSGMDIDGKLNASYVVQGVRGGGGVGLGLCSSDKSIQAIISHLMLFSRVLSKAEISKLFSLNTLESQSVIIS